MSSEDIGSALEHSRLLFDGCARDIFESAASEVTMLFSFLFD
jgi:hypothetical protein